jgi:hypothetical protein
MNLINNIKKFYKYIFNGLNTIYSIYLKNIYLYYMPINTKFIFDKFTHRVDRYRRLKTYDLNQYGFIYKGTNIEYKNRIYYNFGTFYDVSNSRYKYNNKIAIFSDTIESIKLELYDDKKNIYTLLIQDDPNQKINFINSILNCSTKNSRLYILIYYYLQNYLNIKDRISKVYIKTDDEYIEVEHFDQLESIYSKLQPYN